MLDVSLVLSGAALTYGEMVRSDSGLKEWLEKKNWTLGGQLDDKVPTDCRSILLVTKAYDNLKVAVSKEADVQVSVNSAIQAAEEFGKLSPVDKYDILLKAAASVAAKKELLSAAVSVVAGRPSRSSLQFEIEAVQKSLNFAASALLQQEDSERNAHLVIIDSSRPLADACRIGCSEIIKGNGVVVIPTAETALPLFLLAEILHEGGLKGLFNVAFVEKEAFPSLRDSCKLSVVGDFALANQLRSFTSDMQFELCGKTAVVAMETCDIDAAVDAVLSSLRIHSHPIQAAGVYVLVHDSLANNFEWRLRQRLEKSNISEVFNKTADFINLESSGNEELRGTKPEIAKAGAARVVFGGQPSLPIAQSSRMGSTALVMHYRSASELCNLLGSLPFISEVSLWTESQSIAWQILDSINVKRIFVNDIGCSSPGFESRVTVNSGCIGLNAEGSAPQASGAAIGATVDATRNAQRAWQGSTNKIAAITNLVRKLVADDLLKNSIGDVKSLIPSSAAGIVRKTNDKNIAIFEMETAVGVVAILAGEGASLKQILHLIVRAVGEGCAVVYVVPESLDSGVQQLVKLCGSSGIPAGLFCKASVKEVPSLFHHHSIQNVITIGSSANLPKISGDDYRIQSLWQLDEKVNPDSGCLKSCFSVRKLVTLTYGDGLGN